MGTPGGSMKRIVGLVLYILRLAVFCLLICYGSLLVGQAAHDGTVFDKETDLDAMVFATVTAIDRTVQDAGSISTEIVFTAKTFAGGKPGIVQGRQIIDLNSKITDAVSVGDRVVLLSYGDGLLFQYFFRLDKIALLGAALAILLIWMGGAKGFNTIVSLTLTCLSIFVVYVPAISAGYNIYAASVVVCIYIILMTFSLVYGANKKSAIAALSCITGVVFSGVLTSLMNRCMKLTGYINEDMYMLGNQLGFDIDVKALIFAMITLGALGAVMDVSMSITSALWELKQTNAKISAGALTRSGMNIGRDIMGTMSNTLILAYIGSSLVVVMLYASSHYSLLGLLNKEEIIFEFLQSLVGSLSLLFTIPLTAFIAAIVLQ